jgi:GTP-binding protein Era
MAEPERDETQQIISAFLGDEAQEPLSPDHRSGYVAVVGKPNVGKSTLVNALIGHKVAIVSPKPQTTRRRILGILTRPEAQILFLDTPGIHEPKQALNRYMMREVQAALTDCDVILFVTDVSRLPTEDDRRVAERIGRLPQPKLMAMNKADLLDPRQVVEHVAAHEALLPANSDAVSQADEANRPSSVEDVFRPGAAMLTSGVRGDNLEKLLAMLLGALPNGPRYFPAGQITDQHEYILVAELVREQALHFLEQEVPHSVAVAIDDWQRRPNGVLYIAATIYVERESQKGILIGKGGQMLKKIGSAARQEIERALGHKVFLELWAKVRPGWRRDELLVARLLEGRM